MSEQKTTDMSQHFYRASAADFIKIPGSPVAYWASKNTIKAFQNDKLITVADTRLGMATANNDLFLRLWFEVSKIKISFNSKSRN